MQLQLGLSAHSLSQLHAPPPLDFSSQYQPARQMPLPHLLQVPSSQLGPFDFAGVSLVLDGSSSPSPLSLLRAASLEPVEPCSASADDLVRLPVALSPPQSASVRTRPRHPK